MTKARTILGLIAGFVLVLSAAAHSLLGWRELGAELAQTDAPADLVGALRIGWQFGGVAMLAFGAIAISTLVDRLRGRTVAKRPLVVIGIAYVAFGAWAMAVSGGSPFFLLFVVPGVLLVAAA